MDARTQLLGTIQGASALFVNVLRHREAQLLQKEHLLELMSARTNLLLRKRHHAVQFLEVTQGFRLVGLLKTIQRVKNMPLEELGF